MSNPARGTKATDNGKGLSDTEEEWCDRRLSRAARKLVHQHLLQVVRAESSILYHGFLDQSDVWVLLEHWLHANGRRMDQCPLDPTSDTYRIDEEHSVVVDSPHKATGAYPTFAAHQFQKGKRKRTWFECGYNGKKFITRFYLDKHLDKHHKLNELATFCPASDWCKAVGLANCHATALEDEPYYGQGSDGWGDDSNIIRHKWVKKAHSIPCNDAKIREDCHAIMDRCGITDSSQRWCDSLVCPTHRLGDILSTTGWTKESECISHPVAFLETVVGLLLYCCVYFQTLDIADEPIRQSCASSRPVATSSSKKQMLVLIYKVAASPNPLFKTSGSWDGDGHGERSGAVRMHPYSNAYSSLLRLLGYLGLMDGVWDLCPFYEEKMINLRNLTPDTRRDVQNLRAPLVDYSAGCLCEQ